MRPTPSEFQEAWPRIVRALASFTGSLDDAEEYAAEAVARAAAHEGPVDELAAWCITVGKRAWLDEARRRSVRERRAPELARRDAGPDTTMEAAMGASDGLSDGLSDDLDDRLALLFVSCDDALSPGLQMVLALRVVCGLSVARIAHHLGVQESAAAARLTRAKKSLAQARGEYRIPDEAERRARLPVVRACVAGMFTVAHRTVLDPVDALADTGRAALSIADALVAAYPDDTEVRGLRATIRLGLARRPGRLDADGVALALDEVDRSRWDRGLLAAGLDDAAAAMAGRGRFALEAAVSGLHSSAPSFAETDWPRLVVFYRELERTWPSPSVTVARLVAEAHAAPLADLPDVEKALAELVATAPSYAGTDAALALADIEWRTGRRPAAARRYAVLADRLDVPALRGFCLRRAGAA
jgi:RNA polymerase sigma-70 factor (ECF subfamily)